MAHHYPHTTIPRAVSRFPLSVSLILEIKSFTRSETESEVLQKAYLSCGGKQPNGCSRPVERMTSSRPRMSETWKSSICVCVHANQKKPNAPMVCTLRAGWFRTFARTSGCAALGARIPFWAELCRSCVRVASRATFRYTSA